MDSYKVQAVNMPQTSGHKYIVAADAATAGTYNFDWKVPIGTIVEKVTVIRPTAFDAGGNVTMTVGDIATADKFLASTNLKATAGVSETAVAKMMKPVAVYTGGASGDDEYIVRAAITVASGTNSAGAMWVYFDYRFDPSSAYVSKTYGETGVTEA